MQGRTALALLAVATLASCTRGSSGHASLASSTSPGSTVAAVASLNVQILAPADGSGFGSGVAIVFSGRAFDATGAALPGSALAWSSSIDGALGTGTSVVTSLSSGVHQIVLTAQTAAAVGSASVVVVVDRGPATGELASYMASLPSRVLGAPVKLPPTLSAMIAANPCDVNAISGNGALAAAFSKAGTLTVLRYPSPSYCNNVFYVASPGLPAGTGAIENMGAFGGLRFKLASGLEATTWFRDASWTHAQSYMADDSPIVVTLHSCDALGLSVREVAFVDPQSDVLVERYEITRAPTSPVQPDVSVVYFENLSPATEKIPYLPLEDVYFDWLNDFACAYHSGDDAILHFRPKNADLAVLNAFAATQPSQAQLDTWLAAAGTTFGPGVYFALGSDGPSSAFQCGEDLGLAASSPKLDAYADANAGTLSGNNLATGECNAALARDVNLASGQAAVTFYVAASTTPDGPTGSRQTLANARALAYSDHVAAVTSDWTSWLGRARLPNAPADPRTIAVAKRSLIVARTATDKNTGAIVASIATQLPYAQDWVRDGAFINFALDTAGYPEIVEKHNLFYASVQRSSGFFAGTFDMNFYADGVPGGPVPLEIDEAAFGVWTMAAHADFITDPVHRAQYLSQVYPAIKRGADWLAAWRDPLTGLQLPANEDDNPIPTRGLHGAGPVHLALTSAIKAGTATGESASVLQGWQARADELGKAIDTAYWNPTLGTWLDPGNSGNPVGPHDQPTAWLVWPTEKDPFTDPRVGTTCDWLFSQLALVTTKQVTESAYDAKVALSLAFAWQGDPAKTSQLRDAFHFFTDELPIEGTLHVGEVYRLDPTGTTWQNVNDVPHVWEHMLIYHTAVELYP